MSMRTDWLRLRFAAALACALGSWATPAVAQQLPDAGQLLREQPTLQRPPVPGAPPLRLEQPRGPSATAATGGPSFVLRAVRITGASASALSELQSLVAPLTGQETDLAGLQAAAQRLTSHYRQRGYPLALAYLPAQTVQDGMVEIAVLEGRLGRSRFEGHPPSAAVQQLLNPLRPGLPVLDDTVNSVLLLLQEQPGQGPVSAAFERGAAPGDSDLVFSLAPRRPWDGGALLDNLGNRFAGQNRLTGYLNLYETLGLADRLQLQLTATDGGTTGGRVAWDALVAGNGMRTGLAFSASRYQLGKVYERLDASGTARTASLYASQPWLRLPQHRVDLVASLERRALRDRVGAAGLATEKHANVAVIGAEGNHFFAQGTAAWRTQLSAGRLTLQGESERLADAAAARTAGHYRKLNGQFDHQQALLPGTRALLRLQGQAASKNLDSSEKFVLGGFQGVRAHPQGEAAGDSGWLARLELRTRVAPQWDLGLAYDAGAVHTSRAPFSLGANRQARRGWALLAEGRSGAMSVTAALAWRTGDAPTSDVDRRPRLWFQAGWMF